MSDVVVTSLAESALNIFVTIEGKATEKLSSRGTNATDAFATLNTFTGQEAVNRIAEIADGETQSLLALLREPAISRVTVENDEGQKAIYYICRTSGISLNGAAKLAGYRTDLGKLASRDVGEEVEVSVGGRLVWLRVLERVDLHPAKDGGHWDSTNNVLRRENVSPLSIQSLRKLLESEETIDDGGAFEAMLAGGEVAGNITEGLRHQIRSAMALRDQPVLDKFQDDIFRLPINSQLIILGPPGTGKTTTLIKRLGQKLDWDALDLDERSLLDTAAHKSSWVMFTPSDLLKHYVKEAFNREQVPASDEHIKTWDKRRHELARSVFGVLKTNTGGMFVFKEDRSHCSGEVSNDPRAWFDEFRKFHRNRLISPLQEGATMLQSSAPDQAKPLLQQLLAGISSLRSEELVQAYGRWLSLEAKIDSLLKESRIKTDKLIREQGNLLFNKDKRVFFDLAAFFDTLTQGDEEEDDGAEYDEDVTEEPTQPSHNEAQKAFFAYQRFLQSYARSRYHGRSLGKSSRAAHIRDWLDDRVPSEEWLKTLGGEMTFQNALRRFRNAWKRYVLDVPASYRAFRRQCIAEQRYAYRAPDNPVHIDGVELDAIILLMLRSARELMQQEFVRNDLGQPQFFELARIANQFQHQVLVDEATDFSMLQLACMESLTNLKTRSFFACGDFNQRITGHGIRSLEQVSWISEQIRDKRITTVYRQSRMLNAFAGELLQLMDGDTTALGVLPEYSAHEGVMPVFVEGMDEPLAVAQWLAERISEIERMVHQMPTVAVLVASESFVRPIADALSEQLESINLKAVACLEGKALGDDTDVRIFDIQHIKGLEFEAVFFVGVDTLAEMTPDLFERYLYVGATRAATYLGMLCHKGLPEKLSSLKLRFSERW
ncbi:ATP-binding domain-containing protein [Pseudomonas yamanorum]|uniref:DNA 3'-5' helicase II n=1 Tax=Pseudomonas yamanorum TaxID=515393 RepID=A0A7Y8FE60_9PSED|nr:ATP-binding domain-containing protein [Pseudomonas yamanorum]NWE77716.1 ATP-binding domain-containing protein [Pseudomonas yamanorum]